MTLSLDPNEIDIIDIQDKLGYVDTGPIQQQQQQQQQQQRQARTTRNHATFTPATSSTSHIIIKEPIPQRQVQFPMDKKRSSTSARPEIIQDSFHGATQPINTIKKTNSIDATTTNSSIPYPLNVSQQTLQQRPSVNSRSNSFNNKGKEKQHLASEMPSFVLPTSSSSSSSAEIPSKYTSNNGLRGPPQTTQERDEIKDLFVSKFLELKELADMLQLIDEPIPQQQQAYNHRRSFEQPPKPTPSKSDPNNYPQLRKNPSKGRMNAYTYPSPENNRQIYNKSADMTTNYQEPNNRHSTTSRGIYNNNNNNNSNNNRDYLMDHQDNRTPHDGNGYYSHHPHPPQQQQSYYQSLYDDNRDFYLANDDPYLLDHEGYYMAPPQPPPQRMQARYYDGRQRRKSFSNLHEEQYRLNRKGSRGNMRRPTLRQQQQQQFYDYSDIPPSLHHHLHQYPYGAPPYYPNQQYSPNRGDNGNVGGGGGGGGSAYFS